ncbi:amidohydrolase family protein [Marinobacter mobilis]|uniref:Amidohydrolase n=1 Tax=Marinobacter mobilis TaxID=488533 RepID=A0A1H2TKP3_9GAMM|nr:amidohydrolase family protein [Marinobacter mobilis]SDW44347.1 Amidohydrolase [Marinobacter mobilis]
MTFEFFDSLMHIKVDQKWYKTEKRADVEIIKSFHSAGELKGGVVACMPDDDPADIAEITNKELPFCYLVISIKKEWLSYSKNKLKEIFNKFKVQYRAIGIKIHPRFSQLSLDNHDTVDRVIGAAHECGLLVYVCTILRAPVGPNPSLPHYYIAKIAERNQKGDIVFLHGGYTDVFHTGEVIRDYPNAWLDLSFTFMRFRKSALALDCGYLIETLDQKVMIGTDFPEYTPRQLFEELDRYVFQRSDLELSQEKIQNLLGRNIEKLVKKYASGN